jgi:hypothetical protein
LSDELLVAAVTDGVLDKRIEAYLDSFVEFASPHVEEPDRLQALGCSGSGYKTTEAEVLRSLSPLEATISREQGLSLVRRSCGRLREQVLSLRQRYRGARQESEYEKSTGGVPTLLETTLQHYTHSEAVSNP